MSDITYAYAGDITKTTDEDGRMIVYGKATGPDLDLDQQICDPDWLKSAMPEWAAIGNVREMHQPIAAGIGLEVESAGDDWFLKSECVDENTQRKIDRGVLKGYSIGIKNATVVKDSVAKGGRIVAGDIVEISYVDRPANPTATIAIAKGASVDELEAQEAPAITEMEAADLASWRNGQRIKSAVAKAAGDPVDSAVDGTGESTGAATAVNATDGVAEDGSVSAAPVDDPSEPVADAEAAPEPVSEDPAPPSDPDVAEPGVIDPEATIVGGPMEPQKFAAITDIITKAAPPLHDPAALASIRDGLIASIQAELAEFSAGEDETSDIYQLLSSLSTFLCWWADEAAEGETDAPFTDTDKGDDVSYVALGVSPDIIKSAASDDATDEVRDELRAEIVKALGLDNLTDLITETIDKAAGERIEALAADIETIKEMATTGGPAKARTQAQVSKSLDAEMAQAEANRFRDAATRITDPQTKALYMSKAAECDKRAAELFAA